MAKRSVQSTSFLEDGSDPGNWWVNEFKNNTRKGLISRFLFHGSLDFETIIKNSGRCYNTIRKHVLRLLHEGFIMELNGFYKVSPNHWGKKYD